MISDDWEGLAQFFEPGEELLIASRAEDVVEALARPDSELERIGKRARRRVLDEHRSVHRARELVELVRDCSGAPRTAAKAAEVEACGA